MDILTVIVVGVCLLIVVVLLLEPVAQRRREQAMFEQLKKTRTKAEAGSVMDAALQSQRQRKLPEHWWHSYRFWRR